MEFPARSRSLKTRSKGQIWPWEAAFMAERVPLALSRTANKLRGFFRRLFALLKTVVLEFLKDDCPNLAAQISYYALFSVFPLILGVVLLFSAIYNDPIARYNLIRTLTQIFPSGSASVNVSEIVNQTLDHTQQYRPIFLILFFLGAVWGGSGIFDSLSNAINKFWQVPGQTRSILESLVMRFLLFGFFLLLILGSLGISLSYEGVRNFAETNPELSTYLKDNPLWDWLAIGIPWGLNFVTFMILYRVVPQRKVIWADVWPGALIATLLFELVKIGFNYYVTRVVSYGATYGSLAGVVVFVFWLYLSAVVILVGGEASSVWAEMRGEKRPTKLARQGGLAEAPAQTSLIVEQDASLEYSYACEEIFCAYAPPSKLTSPASTLAESEQAKDKLKI